MLPKRHILIGAVFSLLVWIIWPSIGILNTLIIFAASVLIDMDHYLYYIYTKKDFSLRNTFRWFVQYKRKWLKLSPNEREKYNRIIFLFHGIEFWLLLLVLSFISNTFLWILLGIALHMFADFVDLYQKSEPFYSKFSQIYVYITNKKKRRFQ